MEPFLATGTRLGRYEIRAKIGEGGMGEVYLAVDTKLNRKVAIKILPASSKASEQAGRRLIREARAAAKLDHPNICSIHEVGEEEGRSFIVMQYIDGETLSAKISREPPRLLEALTLATQVAEALSEAHAHGIIHRDIKPGNIMVTSRGALKVMDFGLAKLISQSDEIQTEAETEKLISTPGAIMGTVPYMSPEQVRGESLDVRSDIFSFGVMLYEILTGQQPFAGNSSAATASAILTQETLPLARFSHDAPAELERIVSKALRKDKEERYQTAKDLLIDLRTLKDELKFQLRIERSTPPDATRDKSVTIRSGAIIESVQPVVETTAVDQGSTRERSHPSVASASWKGISARAWLLATCGVVVVAIAAWFFWSRANVKWARAQVPRIEELAQAQNYFAAYDLAESTQKYLPDDPRITRLMPTISQTISVTTDPAGGQIYLRRFLPDETGKFPDRQLVGTSPLKNLRVGRGQYILYIEKDGFAKIERTLSGATLRAGSFVVLPPPISIDQKLLRIDTVPERMAFVPGGDYRLVAWARPTDTRPHLNDFFIDKYEVSNQDFKEFINAGGYLKKQYWKYPFVKDGKTLPWEEAIKEFKDRTGLPGPRSWLSQNFPEGKADYPVTDVSWYEAAAYAEFKGKHLPTIFQWEKAARNGEVSPLTNYMPWGVFYPGQTLDHRANFSNDGTMPVNSSEFGMSPFGAYNMAGNVSEWCLNETSQGFLSAGGAWGEPTYTFANYGTFPGFYSSDKRGFRCARNVTGETGDQSAMRIEIIEEIPTYKPSSEASFNELVKYYRYDKTPLDPQIVETKDTDGWRREKITFNGADGERAIAYLYLPRNFARPLQVIHFVPPGDVENGARPLPQAMEDILSPVVKSGRAVFGVVLKGYVERLRPESYVAPDPTTVEYRDKIVNWMTDLRRGLDYLETRNDIDAGRIGFFGPSSGARIGLILAAVENRYRSVFLMGAGVRKSYDQWIPEANPVKFAAHIRTPKLMMHGRYDENLSLKTEAEPLFKLLPQPKRLVLYDGGHVPPLELLVTTINSWLDETLSPVRRE
jgi:serine/threonine protein kinase/formylglycine-generating enzyme required for sulfatase activity